MSATGTVHALAHSPPFDGAVETVERCWVCAEMMVRGIPVKKWQGASFTDQNKARNPDGTHVCEPCAWCMSWVQPPGFPPPEPGKKGLNLRLFSHLWDARGYRALNKASKPEILAWLRGPKSGDWFAAIADTGQKHVLPWTPMNPPGGRMIRFEERTVSLPAADDGWCVVDSITELLTAGVTKSEVQRGEYAVRSYRETGKAALDAFEKEHGRLRGSAWFDLALWLSQRNEEAYANRRGEKGSASNAHGGRRAGTARAVPRGRRQSAEALAADPRPLTDGGTDQRKRSGVGDGDAAVAEDRDAEQLAFFGDPPAGR